MRPRDSTADRLPFGGFGLMAGPRQGPSRDGKAEGVHEWLPVPDGPAVSNAPDDSGPGQCRLQTSTLCADTRDDPVGGHLRVLVLPDPDRRPPCCQQALVGVEITVLVGFDLLRPVPAVGAMPTTAVLGAAMPEAAVDENGDLGTGEDDVGLSGKAWERAPVDAVAQPAPMKDTSERQLRSGVTSGEGTHLLVDCLTGGERRAPALHHVRCYPMACATQPTTWRASSGGTALPT